VWARDQTTEEPDDRHKSNNRTESNNRDGS
jgi:hypothetical protein